MLVPIVETTLPVVTNLVSAAEYAKTFEPYLPQLYALPEQIWSVASESGLEGLKQLYISTNPAISGLAAAIAMCPLFFIASELNSNYSQVDCFWSILPTIFNIHYATWARAAGVPTGKVDSVLAFSLLWSIRLTYNYWRRGGYEWGSEDYRWRIIEKRVGRVGLVLLNITFVSSTQIILLWSVTLPTYILLLTSQIQPEVTGTDMIMRTILIALVVVEWFADQQQWNYQNAKKSYQNTAKVPAGWTRAQLERGFNTSGLWAYSRHPNFAAEQAIWCTLYQWGALISGVKTNWTAVGMIGYLLVFQGSTPLTEKISSQKYPEYAFYQAKVGKFVPTGGSWNEKEIEKTKSQLLAQEERLKEKR